MSDTNNMELRSNVIEFPMGHLNWSEKLEKKAPLPTPVIDEMEEESNRLNRISAYQSEFDWSPLRDLERRNATKPVRGGFLFKTPFRLVNAHATCQQCLYSFEVDTYGRGCVHNCVYCYAKTQLTQHGMWNNPYPVPIDINLIRNVFYSVFETDRKSKWREIMEKRIPIRIGSMSDSFMWSDDKYKVTKEFLRLLNHYKYPHLIFTRSDLVAKDDYLQLLDRKLCSVQFSMSSTNDALNKAIEPGAPSSKRRLSALKKIGSAGIWTTVRINPLFPIYPDGYFTNPDFAWNGEVPKFNFSSFDMVDEIADANVPSILAGFGRFSSFALNQIKEASGVDLRPFFMSGHTKSNKDFHFSDREIRHYYSELKKRANNRKVDFSTCYIGNGENHFWKDQDLWSNKSDCCNVKNKVPAFKRDCREINFDQRLKFISDKNHSPAEPTTLHQKLTFEPAKFEIADMGLHIEKDFSSDNLSST